MELQVIQNKIYTIRNQRVMLDFDLAEIYSVQTKVLNQAMKRNMNRFPDEFVFRLSDKEWEIVRSQFVTASQSKRNRGITPFAFTEYGIAMLASILKSEKAVQMNIAIVRAFIALRQIALIHYDIAGQLNELRDRLGEHDVQLAAIYDTIETLLDKKMVQETWENRNLIGFKRKIKA